MNTAGTHTMGPAALVRLIQEQSASEVAEVLGRAHERAAQIAAAAESEATKISALARQEGEQRGQRAAAEIFAVADAESRRQQLWDREALVNEVLHAVRKRLEGLPDLPDGPVVLQELIREALQVLPHGAVRVRWPAEYQALLDETTRGELAGGRWQIRFEADNIPGGGVVVETVDGRLRFDNTFGARLRRRADHLRRLVVDILLTEKEAASEPR